MLSHIVARIESELKLKPKVVLFVEEDMLKELLQEALRYHGLSTIKSVKEEEEFLPYLRDHEATVLIYSVSGEETKAKQNLENLRSLFPRLKIFVIVPFSGNLDLAMLFLSSADEVIQKPFSIGEFLARLAKLLHTHYLELKVQNLLIEDPLTSAYNRRYFESQIREEALRAVRYNLPLSLIMIDLDKFKIYNDTRGHAEGDKVLQGIVLLLCENTRLKVDKVCRYGGDEFVIILPHTNWKRASVVAKRIIRSYEASPFDPVTLSLGVAQLIDRGDLERSISDLISRADAALYEAKKTKGNSFVIDAESIRQFLVEEPPALAQPSQSQESPHPPNLLAESSP